MSLPLLSCLTIVLVGKICQHICIYMLRSTVLQYEMTVDGENNLPALTSIAPCFMVARKSALTRW